MIYFDHDPIGAEVSGVWSIDSEIRNLDLVESKECWNGGGLPGCCNHFK